MNAKSLLLSNTNNSGPHRKEFLLELAECEFNRGNLLNSVFYQVKALFQSSEERYNEMKVEVVDLSSELLMEMNDWEREDFKSNTLMQFLMQEIKSSCNTTKQTSPITKVDYNFLKNIDEPELGVKMIEKVCSELPKEWTVLQLCKGRRTENTYSVFPKIHEYDAPVYLTLLRHSRSSEYPTPICLQFSGVKQSDLFKSFANIASRFKKCVSVDPANYTTNKAKKQYWDILDEINESLALIIAELQNFFYPWNFLFTGIPRKSTDKNVFTRVDKFCIAHEWSMQDQVLLSLAAQHVNTLSEFELQAICKAIARKKSQSHWDALKMLLKLKNNEVAQSDYMNGQSRFQMKFYPCLLVLDERLDHFHWEELNVGQEFCRFNSLQSLWRLYQIYKDRIQQGYLRVNITDGGCVINPDKNLPKTERRMRSFFEHWSPHWLTKYAEKPTQEELFGDYFKRSCYVYAGHGSGLQHINGKHIAKQHINAVVFLFGCDSARLCSNGLFSELIGPHFYYQAAECPTLVGTLMPGLDANMDSVTTEILSRWIAPHTKDTLPWHEIDRMSWLKEGKVVKPNGKLEKPTSTMANYHCGSLCAVVAGVHQRINEIAFYNTVQYVCRGLPVWNCDVQPIPK